MKINIIQKIISLDKKIELIGSNANDDIKYKTDYDFQEIILDTNLTGIVTEIQKMFRELKKLKDCYVVDFKAGFYMNEPIRWDYNEILNGYKYIELRLFDLKECLADTSSKVKIDIIAYIDGEYREISCNYYFIDATKPTNDIYLSLMLDIKKYYHEKKYMKMFKRIYSYKIVKGEDVSDLIEMFNSKIGFLYSVAHRVELVIFIQENKLVEKVNEYKVTKMIKDIYKMLPESWKEIKSLSEVKSNLSKLINKLLIKY